MMQDRLKFRIYDTEEKAMHYADFVVTSTGYVAKIYYIFNNVGHFNQADFEFDKNCIVMQCTGLKDKNGKLIFEGDIVKIKVLQDFEAFGNNEKYIDIVGQVIFNYGGFFIEQAENDIFLGQMPESELEVIGNIYENKELLDD